MLPHTQVVAALVLALWAPPAAAQPLQPRPFRIEGPTPLPPDAPPPTTHRPHARAPPAAPPRGASPPPPPERRAPTASRDQQSAATQARAPSLRSPLALRLLQEAYVHSAAQEAMAADAAADARRQHRLLALPQHHHRHVVIPSPEAARLLAHAVNHNLLADEPHPLQEQPILGEEQPLRLQADDPLQLPAPVELRPDAEGERESSVHDLQRLRPAAPSSLQVEPTVRDLHLQPDAPHARPPHAEPAAREQQEIAENQEPGAGGGARYDYMYRVRDFGGSHFGHAEQRAGERTWGHYYVQLPDGRLKTVRYWADDSGYHAEVEYEGKATHPGDADDARR